MVVQWQHCLRLVLGLLQQMRGVVRVCGCTGRDEQQLAITWSGDFLHVVNHTDRKVCCMGRRESGISDGDGSDALSDVVLVLLDASVEGQPRLHCHCAYT